MRKRFAELLESAMKKDERIVVFTADLGYGLWDSIRVRFPGRFFNVGAAEQAMIGIAVGAVLTGKIAVCYSITPFLLYRPFELIRNHLARERIAVKLVGSGRDRDYTHDGPTHWAEEDDEVLELLDICGEWPHTIRDLEWLMDDFLADDGPAYLNLRR